MNIKIAAFTVSEKSLNTDQRTGLNIFISNQFIQYNTHFHPYRPSVPFVGYRQTVQPRSDAAELGV